MLLPARFGRYLLLDKIATGGMAEIFKAKLLGVEGFEKIVVIKRILPFWSERRDFVTMLIDEAKILVHLNHANIVQVFELGCEDNTYFIAMEYVEGTDVRHLFSKLKSSSKRIPQNLVLMIVAETLKGLHYAHQRSLKEQGHLGIVHRDVSPQNILISYDGEVKVTDFGIAKAMIKTHETQTGVLKGKYAYMSPEQALGKEIDARTDIFACGVVLYELLFQERLFASKSDIETLDKVRKAQVIWPEQKDNPVSDDVKKVLAKALALEPEDRYATAEDFEMDLKDCIPRDQRPTQRELGEFLKNLFTDEIQNLKQKNQNLTQATQSIARQTRVSADMVQEEKTVSTVEAPAEAAHVQAEVKSVVPIWARIKAKKLLLKRSSWVLSILALFLISFAALKYYSGRGSDNDFQTDVVSKPVVKPPSPLVVPTPETRPNVKPVVTTTLAPVVPPSESKPTSFGWIRVKANPPEAKIYASYLDQKFSGVGELYLESVPADVEVAVKTELSDYLPETKTFKLTNDKLNINHTFELEKRPPGFGSIQVSAAPWGRVTMGSFLSNSETPLSRSRIPEGSYRISVFNSTYNKTASTTAVIRSGRTTRCAASFSEASAKVFCR